MRILAAKEIGRLLKRRAARLAEAEETVRPILEAVRQRGDRALMEYARKFDGFEGRTVRVPDRDLRAAEARLTPAFRRAAQTAAANIRAYAERQMPREWTREMRPGLRLGQIVRPLDTVAAYIPAGRYPLPSTLLMTAVPAQVAGVPNICVASPRPVAEVLGTASLLGIGKVFQMGGAQAIAAFAFGTRTVPRADRIVGPGNIYVAAAKKLLAGEVGIDFVAGPTEIVIVAAEGDPRLLAADMLAQAEHDADASAVLLTTSKQLAAAVAREVDRQLAVLPTAPVAAKSIARNSAVVLVGSLDEAMEIGQPLRAGAPERSGRRLARESPPCRRRVRGGVQSGGRGRLRFGTEPCAADRRRGPAARRPGGGRLCQSDLGAGIVGTGVAAPRAGHRHAGARRGPGSTRALGGSEGGGGEAVDHHEIA